MSGSLKYICQFCKVAAQHVGHMASSYNRHDWFKCNKCDVYYTVEQNGKLSEMGLNCEIDKKNYQFQLNYDTNSSRIVLFPNNTEDTVIIIADIDGTPVFKDKPKDLERKIRTYMVFS